MKPLLLLAIIFCVACSSDTTNNAANNTTNNANNTNNTNNTTTTNNATNQGDMGVVDVSQDVTQDVVEDVAPEVGPGQGMVYFHSPPTGAIRETVAMILADEGVTISLTFTNPQQGQTCDEMFIDNNPTLFLEPGLNPMSFSTVANGTFENADGCVDFMNAGSAADGVDLTLDITSEVWSGRAVFKSQ